MAYEDQNGFTDHPTLLVEPFYGEETKELIDEYEEDALALLGDYSVPFKSTKAHLYYQSLWAVDANFYRFTEAIENDWTSFKKFVEPLTFADPDVEVALCWLQCFTPEGKPEDLALVVNFRSKSTHKI